MAEQTASRSLHKLRLVGTVSVGDLSYADFSIDQLYDVIEGIFIGADRIRINEVELYFSSNRLATYKLSPNSNEIKFFSGPFNLSCFGDVIIRVICHGKGAEHAKLWVLSRERPGERNIEDHKVGNFTIPKEISFTGDEIIFNCKDGQVNWSCTIPDENTYYPVYRYSCVSDKHFYNFKIPRSHHNLTQMKIRGCEHKCSDNSGFKVQLQANEQVMQEWVFYYPQQDITSLFIDEENNGHPLQIGRCPFNDFRIVLECKEKLKEPSLQLILKNTPQQERFDWEKHSPKVDEFFRLKSGKVIFYGSGSIGLGTPGDNWVKK